MERTSGFVQLVHLPIDHTAKNVSQSVAITLASLPASMRRSLTWDQGAEMSEHATITDSLADGVFFAHAGSPWQRGSNENANGLLRRYFPNPRPGHPRRRFRPAGGRGAPQQPATEASRLENPG
ncbi:MAG: IS30 family transposase [Solirubrobacterales bacterium]